VIAATRLDDEPLTGYAARTGVPYWRALKRRQRTEARLVQAIRDGELRQ
jgi:hypothetical protein